MTTIEIKSKNNFATAKDNRTRLRKLNVEQNESGTLIITGVSQKGAAAKFPPLKLELDAEGVRALQTALKSLSKRAVTIIAEAIDSSASQPV